MRLRGASWMAAVLAALFVLTPRAASQGEGTRRQQKAMHAKWASDLKVLQRRREVVKQRIQELMRRRIAHDLLIPLTADELLRGIPKGDPLQREALEKSLALDVEKTRELRETLQSLRDDASRLSINIDDPKRYDPGRIPAAPGGPGVTGTRSAEADTNRGAKKKVEAVADTEVEPSERRFDLVPRADGKDDYIERALPFAFDEVASTIPAVETIVRTAPAKNVLRRTWTLIRAGMHRRALEVIRGHAPEEDKRPFALRFLEARALEGLDLFTEAEAIYGQIRELDLVSREGAEEGEAANADKRPGGWALASEAALQALQFRRRFPKSALPKTAGLKW